MIPKIIHYIWFGGNPLPEDAIKCIESWKKYCPDYEIKEWNESNFDLNSCSYIKEAYQAKKWAFVSDYARLYVLYKYGGIYMDTDVEVIKPLDRFLKLKAFSGFENERDIPTGIMACEKSHPLFEELLSEYDHIHFIDENGNYDLTTNVTRITKTCVKKGLVRNNRRQTIADFTLFPKDVFCPLNSQTGILEKTKYTHTIHWFSGSWKSQKEKEIHSKSILIQKKIPGFMGKIIGYSYEYIFKTFLIMKEEGIKSFTKRLIQFIQKRSGKVKKNND